VLNRTPSVKMKSKSKKLDHKAGEHARHASVDEHAGAGARHSFDAAQAPGKEPKALTYRKDPNYRRLLEHFQRADWEGCLQNLDHLLRAHPADAYLLAFKQDVQIRAEQQKQSQNQQESDEHQRRRNNRRRALLGGLSGTIILALLAWFGAAYQAEETRQNMAAQATQTAEALAAKDKMADTFMRAGKAEQALALYTAIRETDPSYEGIDEAIDAAQLSITAEGLYQQGTRAMADGDNDTALGLLRQVQKLQPEYKDTSQLIAQISREQQIASLAEGIQVAYNRGDSEGVIKNYEAIQAIDPLIQLPELDDELFASYRDLVLQLAARSDPTLEEIQTAARYYRNALALFPQNFKYARERAELQEVAVELIASQYYLQGISLLESSDYSIEGLEQSILVLRRAREKAPGSRIVDAAMEKAQLFIDSYDQLVHGDWDAAITGLEALYRRDPDFADGRVRYFLYEAYSSRGDLLMLNADFGGAFADYQAAERFAWANEENVLRLFQIEVRLAAALAKLGKFDQAAEFYHFAFQQVGYQERLTGPAREGLLETLLKADSAKDGDNAFSAIDSYKEAVKQADEFYELTRIDALRGDTLPNIAFENGSTLSSLRTANDLGDSLIIGRSRELFIPILPALPQ
jgi:tetratricopeptide (TPR) repeat protein